MQTLHYITYIYCCMLTWSYLHTLVTAQLELTVAQHKFLRRGAFKRMEERPDFIPRLVQMTFHDCVGGCDGCINLAHHGNLGLDETYQWVQSFRNDYAPYLSLADVIAFCGIEALKIGAAKSGNPLFVPFSIGRKDCDSSQGMPVRNLPEHALVDSVVLLKDMFNLNDKEAVALLGCHSLGACHRNRSGFDGDWDASPNNLDNGFFLNLASNDWTVQNVSNDLINSSSWTRPHSNFIMLHSDMSMMKKFTTSGDLDTPSCNDMNECPDSNTANIVLLYARNNTEFLENIGVAFQKMLDFGQKDLKVITLG